MVTQWIGLRENHENLQLLQETIVFFPMKNGDFLQFFAHGMAVNISLIMAPEQFSSSTWYLLLIDIFSTLRQSNVARKSLN